MLGRAFRNVTLIAALAMTLPATVQAQSLYVGGGVLIPISDFEDDADAGFMGIGGISFDIGDSGFAVGAEGMYGPGSGADDGPDIDVYSAMGWLLYGFGEEGSVAPYIFGGAGILGCNADSSGPTPASCTDDDTNFGYQGGAGLDVPLSDRVNLFFEGRYMGSTDIDIIGALAGLSIGLGG